VLAAPPRGSERAVQRIVRNPIVWIAAVALIAVVVAIVLASSGGGSGPGGY